MKQKIKQKKKTYHILPTIKVLEGLMFIGQVCRVGFNSYLSVAKIPDEKYIEMVKSAVGG